MSTAPPSAAPATNFSSSSSTSTTTTTRDSTSLKQLKSSLHLDFSSANSSRKQIFSAELLNLIKASPTIEKMLSQGSISYY